MRVLVVEDERFLAEMIAEGLRRDAITVDVSHDGAKALRRLAFAEYDVVILDRDLPGMHGDEVCRRVVAESLPTRVLMLTASGSVRDRVDGLSLGADDYLPKPFAYAELLARVLALGRRSQPALPPAIERGGVVLDSGRRAATRHGRALSLSRKEFAVLEVLLRADGAVVSNEDLIERVWEENTSYRTNAARITVSKLRAKLGDPPLIETVTGAGYRVLRERSGGSAPAGAAGGRAEGAADGSAGGGADGAANGAADPR